MNQLPALTIKYNSKNEILKTRFLKMLGQAKGRDPKTVQAHANAIHEFEIFTNFKEFRKFEINDAIGFKEYLSNKINKRTGESISKSYLQHYTSHTKAFFEWIINQNGYRYIKFDDVQYFNISRNDRNRALATGYQESYEVCEILETIRKMPFKTEMINLKLKMIKL
jgi:site-specific recombinase XerD